MIHVLITADTSIRDLIISEYELHPHPTDTGVHQSKGVILIYRAKLVADLIPKAFTEYSANKIWIMSISRIVSTDHELGDIVMPNVFLAYNHEIDTVEFSRTNRDNFLHDPLFLQHYEEQSDLNFDSFGLSIGGICVTKEDGMNDIDREQIEFAYSADSVDEACYFLIAEAQKLNRSEDVYPVLAIVGQNSSDEEKAGIIKNIPPVVAYLQQKTSGEDVGLMDLHEREDDFDSHAAHDFDTDLEMEGFHQVRE